jgi:hypothetical protein
LKSSSGGSGGAAGAEEDEGREEEVPFTERVEEKPGTVSPWAGVAEKEGAAVELFPEVDENEGADDADSVVDEKEGTSWAKRGPGKIAAMNKNRRKLKWTRWFDLCPLPLTSFFYLLRLYF